MNFYPHNKTTIYIRLFNFRDEIDNLDYSQQYASINIDKLGREIWNLGNEGNGHQQQVKSIEIEEVSLNMLRTLEEQEGERLSFGKFGVEKEELSDTQGKLYIHIFYIEMKIVRPQRFRSFRIHYVI